MDRPMIVVEDEEKVFQEIPVARHPIGLHMTNTRSPPYLPEKATVIAKLEPTVFVVDDDAEVLEALEALISTKGWETKLFSSAQDFLTAPKGDGPCCLVLDVSLPGLSGLDLQTKLNADGNHIPIIFITGFGDIPMTVRAMKAGAAEFLTKPFNHEDLFGAIDRALRHSRATADRKAEVQDLRDRHAAMSRREQEVMALVVRGLLNKQVGYELGISEITVKAHRGRMMRKMNARSLADLITMAAKIDRWPLR